MNNIINNFHTICSIQNFGWDLLIEKLTQTGTSIRIGQGTAVPKGVLKMSVFIIFCVQSSPIGLRKFSFALGIAICWEKLSKSVLTTSSNDNFGLPEILKCDFKEATLDLTSKFRYNASICLEILKI